MLEQDVVANNIANSTTVGYKKDAPVFEAFPNRLLARIHDRMDQPTNLAAAMTPPIVQTGVPARPIGIVGQGVKAVGTVTQFSEGNLRSTGEKLDLALEGDALFTVQRADGSTAYTRAGNFTIDAEKRLCTQDGDLVMAKSGQPVVLDGNEVVFGRDGSVKLDGNEIGNLAIAPYDASRFDKLGENLYVRNQADIEPVENEKLADNVHVMQGYLEDSNVQVVTEMVHMISLMRAYEANTKTINTQDESLNQLMTSVGTPSA
jgi:flagellar basal-body rod protein FlgG